jgi:hypothetical protein
MCDAATAIAATSLAIGTISSGASFIGQSQAASQQADYQNQLAEQRNQQMLANRQLALASYYDKIAQEQLAQQQADASASQALTQQAVASASAQAAARVSAGEAGVAGLSLEQLLQDYDMQEAQFRDSVLTQRDWQADQSGYNMNAAQREAKARIDSIQPYIPAPVTMPSLLTSFLQIGSTAVNSATMYKSMGGWPASAPAPASDTALARYATGPHVL